MTLVTPARCCKVPVPDHVLAAQVFGPNSRAAKTRPDQSDGGAEITDPLKDVSPSIRLDPVKNHPSKMPEPESGGGCEYWQLIAAGWLRALDPTRAGR